MIVPMKKVALLCLSSDKDNTLAALGQLGVLHVTPTQPPQGADLEAARRDLEAAQQALFALEEAKKAAKDTEPAEAPGDVMERARDLLARRKALAEEAERLAHERSLLEPYGEFDPETVGSLAEAGISVRFYSVQGKTPLPSTPDGCSLVVTSRTRTATSFVVIGPGDAPCEAPERRLPPVSLSHVRTELGRLAEEQSAVNAELARLSKHRALAVDAVQALEEKATYIETRRGMGESETIAYLTGYCPDTLVEALERSTAEHGWGLRIEDPAPTDNVPTLVRYPRVVKPVKAVFDFLGILPGYREADIGSVFLLFFSIFFGILIGDAGYGALLLLVTLVLRRKFRTAPSYVFSLFIILWVLTIVWGVMTANYFGINPDVLPNWMQALRVEALTGTAARDNIIRLCFLIGAIHLTVAHVWNICVYYPNSKWLAEAGWGALVWCMFYTARHYVLGEAYPPWLLYVFLAGITLVVLFMTAVNQLKKEIIHHFMLPLDVVSCFVDVVSYIRLFAVGMASAKVAMSFNDMAMSLGEGRAWALPFVILILVGGHCLNIALCALGILVHAVRLNTLEFSLHRNMQWSGFAYKPFEHRKQTTVN